MAGILAFQCVTKTSNMFFLLISTPIFSGFYEFIPFNHFLHHYPLNNIRAEGASAFAESENLSTLESLDISHNHIRAEGASAIAESENLSTLESLDLSSNQIGAEGASAFAESENLSTLE